MFPSHEIPSAKRTDSQLMIYHDLREMAASIELRQSQPMKNFHDVSFFSRSDHKLKVTLENTYLLRAGEKQAHEILSKTACRNTFQNHLSSNGAFKLRKFASTNSCLDRKKKLA